MTRHCHHHHHHQAILPPSFLPHKPKPTKSKNEVRINLPCALAFRYPMGYTIDSRTFSRTVFFKSSTSLVSYSASREALSIPLPRIRPPIGFHPSLPQQFSPHNLRRAQRHLFLATSATPTQTVLTRPAITSLPITRTRLPPVSAPEEIRQEFASSVQGSGIGSICQRRTFVLTFNFPVVATATNAAVEVRGFVVLGLVRAVGIGPGFTGGDGGGW